MLLLTLLASLYGLMILVRKWLSLPYAQVPFVTIISLMSVLYVAGLFGLLWYVSWFVFLAGLVCFALSLYKSTLGIPSRTFFRRLISDHSLFPLTAFGVLFLFSWFVFRNAYITEWDEFSFWSIFTKIAVNYNAMIAGFNDINKADYPRITTLLQYYFLLFLRGGSFHEGTAIFAQTVIFLSALPVFLSLPSRSYNVFLLCLITFCFYSLVDVFTLPVFLLYADSVLGLCWGMSILLYLINRKQDRVVLIITSLCLFSMVQVKEMGLVFACCTIFIVMIDEGFFSTFRLPVVLKRLGVLTAVVLVSFASWSMFKSYNGVVGSSFSLDIGQIYDSLFDLRDYQRTTAENFLYSLIHIGNVAETQAVFDESHQDRFIGGFAHQFHFFEFSLGPSYWAIIFVIFMSLSYWLAGNTSKKIFASRSRCMTFTICLLASLATYTCLLLVVYMFVFFPYEGVRLASFGRYLGTAYLGLFLVLFYCVLGAEKKSLLVAFTVLIFCVTSGSSIKSVRNVFHKSDVQKYYDDLYEKIDPVIEEIKGKGGKPKILLIDQGTRGSFHARFIHRAFPLRFHPVMSVNTEEKDGWPPETWIGSADDFSLILQQCDYLIVWSDAEFLDLYGDSVRRSALKAVWMQDNDRFVRFSPERLPKTKSWKIDLRSRVRQRAGN